MSRPDCGSGHRKKAHAYEGETGRDRRYVPDTRGRHRLTGSPGRAAHRAHPAAHRPPAHTQEGPPFAPGTAEAGGAAPPPARVPQQEGRRALPFRDLPPGPPQVAEALAFGDAAAIARGSTGEPAAR